MSDKDDVLSGEYQQASNLSLLCDYIRERVTGGPALLKAVYETLGGWVGDDANSGEAIALKHMLRKVQFSPEGICRVCGGHFHHDTACVLGALIDPEIAKSYRRETGQTAIDDLVWEAQHQAADDWRRIKGDLDL
jgi:hypothetical protein